MSTDAPPPGPTEYPVAAAVRVRLMGALLLLVGVLVIVVVGAVVLLGLPGAVVSVLVVVVLLLVGGGGYAVTRRTWLVRVDPVGYRVRLVRGAGVRAARWEDVHDVATSTVQGSRCVVLRLQDGRTTTIPVTVLQGDPEAFVRGLRARLDRAHGYRR